MDKTLERILSLLPRKEDGRLRHGARSDFARSIGYADGHIVSMWESGSSDSYKKKLHEIAAKYDVSVEWLRGETDEKMPAPKSGTVTPEEKARRERLELLDALFMRLTPEEQERFLGRLEGIVLSREGRDGR